ncbi:arylsulfatase [Lignipirellula cremea]|uniref:Arylsulfatase n=1 Tax=Lignipirellula cremea TaxID=2528010 RepID=A0A518DRT3_9BACT|nr:arylsulfatase [Lignipirellula cremea]QDU94555.1 Arylsulfatase [Lignipirellula cremea]
MNSLAAFAPGSISSSRQQPMLGLQPACLLPVALLLVAGLALSGHAAETVRPPNIVLILADDAGYGDFGSYGAETIPTPRLDQLAREGLQFTQHYAGSTVCAPSRCVLLTGLHTGHCRIRGNTAGTLLPEDVTLAEVLKEAGYRTACIGKWGVGVPPLDDPARNGFDEFFGYVSMWHAHNFYPEFLIRNGEKVALDNLVPEKWKSGDGRGVASKKVDYVPHLLIDEAVKFIETNQDRPFFLYYALNTPHANNEAQNAPQPEKGMETPSFGPFADRDWPAPEKGFAAMMRDIDLGVGRIVDKLAELKLEENTLLLFTSDNGPHQEGGHLMEFFNSNGSNRGMKRDLYEGGVRVPLIIRWPGKIAPGQTTDHLSGFQDLLPTLAAVAGAKAPTDIDGLNLEPLLLGKKDAPRHEYLYWEFRERGGKRAIRQGPWKLVQRDIMTAKPLPPELYLLTTDPTEENDIAELHPEQVARLLPLLQQAHTPSKPYPLFPSEEQPAGK